MAANKGLVKKLRRGVNKILDIEEMKADGKYFTNQAELARMYGVTKQTVSWYYLRMKAARKAKKAKEAEKLLRKK